MRELDSRDLDSRALDSPDAGSPDLDSPDLDSTDGDPQTSAGEDETGVQQPGGADHRWGWVAGWTVLGTAVPGAGLIAAGYRRIGGAILALAFLLPTLGAVLLMRRGAIKRAVTLGTDQETLLIGAAAVTGGGLLLIGLMVVTNRILMRRTAPGRWMHGANLVLVTALVAVIAVPTGTSARYLLITRNTLPSVFGNSDSGATRPDGEAKNPWEGIPRVNLLLIGSDAAEGRDGVRTDSMILASIDTDTGDTVLLSLPRNLQRVPFPKGSPAREAWPHGFGNTRGEPWPKKGPACGALCDLSGVWRWGEENAKKYYRDEDNPGAAALRSAIEGAFGLKVDAHVVVDLEGFKAVVDALGGLTVDVHQRLPIAGTTSRPITGKWIEPGENQTLDGYQAMWFARSRSTTSDYDRMARQRCVIGAVVDQADPVSLVRAYPRLAKAAGDNITTDIAAEDLPAWVDLSLKIKKASVRSLPFTDKVISYAHPNYRKIRALVDESLESPENEPAATPTGSSVAPGTGGADEEESKPSGKPEPTKKADPKRAQDVDDVC